MLIDPHALKADMTQLAAATWAKLAQGDDWRLSFREDSLTDHNLWSLASDHPGLHVHRFSQNEEAVSGADWEWWIGSDATGWLQFLVQAKRSYKRSYPALRHFDEEADEYQYDKLLAYAAREGAYALHVFYNGWNPHRYGSNLWPGTARWLACPNGRLAGSCRHAAIVEYGCAIASTQVVKATHESGSRQDRLVASHLSNALPWSYMFGVPHVSGSGSTARPHGSPAGATSPHHQLAWLEQLLRALHSTASNEDVPLRRALAGDLNGESLRRTDLPSYVSFVREVEPENRSTQDHAFRSRGGLVVTVDLGD